MIMSQSFKDLLQQRGYIAMLVDSNSEQFYQNAITVYQKTIENQLKFVLVTVHKESVLVETVFHNSQGIYTAQVSYELQPGEDTNGVLTVMEGLDSEF